MVKVKNENTFHVGDTVWWFDSWQNLRTGSIYEMKTAQVGKLDPVDMALIYENGRKGAHIGAKLSECWPTKEDCLAAENQRSQLQIAEYEASIKDVNDLVKFLFEHDINGENHDYEAEAAAKAKAKDLLGLDVDHTEEDAFTAAVNDISVSDDNMELN